MPKRQVKVVSCPNDFTGTTSESIKPVKKARVVKEEGFFSAKLSKGGLTIKTKGDFDNMFKSVQSLGSEQFTGYKRKLTKEANYQETVGKPLKRNRVPQNILAGMINKQQKREDKASQLARDAGIVTSTNGKGSAIKSASYSEKNRRNNHIMGPAPSNGFSKGGILHVKR